MRNYVVAFTAFCVFAGVQAQNSFKLGPSIGLGSAPNEFITNMVLGADLLYLFNGKQGRFAFGPTAGVRIFFLDGFDDGRFLPLAGAARLTLWGAASAGLDLGYALGITSYLEGGLYFRPVLAYQIGNSLELFLSYENISDAERWENLNMGILLSL